MKKLFVVLVIVMGLAAPVFAQFYPTVQPQMPQSTYQQPQMPMQQQQTYHPETWQENQQRVHREWGQTGGGVPYNVVIPPQPGMKIYPERN